MKKILTNKRIKIFLMSFCVTWSILVFFGLGINKSSYAMDNSFNYMGDYVLNPKWVEYMDLSDEEKAKFDVIPEKFIYEYKKLSSNISLFGLRNRYPEYYNLADEGYSTAPGNQGSLGICWAFAGLSSVETNMLMNGMSDISNPINFSERQLDYVGVHSSYIKEGYNPYYIYGRTYPGTGGYPNTAFVLMENGISPVTEEVFGSFDEFRNIKSMDDVFSIDNVEYVVDGYINYGSIGDYTDEETRKAWVNDIKNHVMNYGSVAITTIGPLSGYAGSCLYDDEKNDNYMLNVSGDCNPINENNKHAMAIIGWDDNYEYEYCRKEDETTNDLTDCNNIVSGKGAFILKNSWEDLYPYPYFAYTSNVDGAYGVTKVSEKNWDVNYNTIKSHNANYAYKESIVTYHKSSGLKENLKKISFYSNSRKDITYDVYVSDNGVDNYSLVDSINTNQIGLSTVYIDDILLEKESFSIKIVSSEGYVDSIYAYTSYVSDSDKVFVDTVIKTGSEYGKNFVNFSLYTVTRNIKDGELIKYKFIDSDGNDISNLVTIVNNVVLNNMINPTFIINNEFPVGEVEFQTIYNNQVYDSKVLTVTNLKSLWTGGNGTVEDPFLIRDVNDFLKIYTASEYMEAHYKLVGDLEFYDIYDWDAGRYTDYQSFKGSIDGNGYIIFGLDTSTYLTSLFYKVENATFKNLVFTEMNLNVNESGWGNLISVLAYDSIFENIVITGTVNITGSASYAGGLVGTAYNSTFKNVANYGSITTNYLYSSKAAGIVIEAYGTEIIESYNYGNINAVESIVGGIVSYLGNDSETSNISSVSNCYNYGNIVSNVYAGGIVGMGDATLVENCYNVFSNIEQTEFMANIVGHSKGMVIKNCYYLSGNGNGVANDEDNKSTIVNVMEKTDEQLKKEQSYLNFDFDNVWIISDGYAYFRNFQYVHMEDFVIKKHFKLKVGDIVNLDIKCIPENVSMMKFVLFTGSPILVNIDTAGNIIALAEGEMEFLVRSLDGSNIEKEIKITITSEEFNLDDYEIIDEKYIKVDPLMSKETFLKNINFDNSYELKLSSEGDYVATGDKLELYDEEGNLEESYQILVLGDLTGTGDINVSDVAKLYQYIKGIFDMDDVFKKAGDVVVDSELKVNDVAKIYQYVKKIIESLEE